MTIHTLPWAIHQWSSSARYYYYNLTVSGSQHYHCEALLIQQFDENILGLAHPNKTPFEDTDAWRALKELCPSAILHDKHIALSSADMTLLAILAERV